MEDDHSRLDGRVKNAIGGVLLFALGILIARGNTIDVRTPSWDEKEEWIVIDHGNGLKHYYRQGSVSAVIDPRDDAIDKRTMIVVGGREYYVPINADEIVEKFYKGKKK